jgi:hypothetical protein
MNKIVEIFKAWNIKYDPTHAQSELAGKRIEICNAPCDYKSDAVYSRCTVCGCSLKTKIFSPVQGACPKGFWDGVDKEHFEKQNVENYNNLKK